MNLSDLLQWNVSLFLLILARWAGMVMLAPVFGANGVPAMVKLGLAAGVSAVVFPMISATNPVIPSELLPWIAILIKETLMGLVMGFIMNLITYIIQGAGQLIDFQMGFTMGNVIDPLNGMQTPMSGSFLALVATMLLLATDSHHYILAAMVKSYHYIPIDPSGISYSPAFFIALIAKVFALSIQIAMPIFGAIFLADVGVGLLTKTVPQLNIFSVIFPVKIIFGFVIFWLMMPLFGESVSRVFEMSMQWLYELFRGWST